MAKPNKRLSLAKDSFTLPVPDYINLHKESYQWFLYEGLKSLFEAINPVKDSLGRIFSLEFGDFRIGKPHRTEEEALDQDLTHNAPIFVKVKLTNLRTGEVKEQEVFVLDIPMMTERGYFIINGVMRMVVFQIVRSEGVLYLPNPLGVPGAPNRYLAKLIPQRGVWYTFDINRKGVVTVRLLRQRVKILITTLLRALKGYTNQEILELFKDVDQGELKYIEATLERDKTKTKEEAIMDIYTKLRPNEVISIDRANKYVRGFFFNSRRFLLGEVARYQLNAKLGLKIDGNKFTAKDLIAIVKNLILVNRGEIVPDDPDSLDHRRIKRVGESLYDTLQDAMVNLERNIKDRMSRVGTDEKVTPSALLNTKVLESYINSFFGMGQLSVFMDQVNIFSVMCEITKITAKGPGGLSQQNAGFSVRDVHFSQYSRICPVATPEGSSVGLTLYTAMYAQINKYGFMEAPFRKLKNKVKNTAGQLENRILAESLKGKRGVSFAKGKFITKQMAKSIASGVEKKEIKVYPFLTNTVDYLSYHVEKGKVIAMSQIPKDEYGNIKPGLTTVRQGGHFTVTSTEFIDYVDAKGAQMQGLGLGLIPFAASNEGYRCMMGSNMQKQAIPVINPEAPIVGTGVEEIVARQSGWGAYADFDGVVDQVDADQIVLKSANGRKRKAYEVINFRRTNDETSITQKSLVNVGDKVKKGDILMDGPSMENGELALGKNVTVAVMPFEGYNYDDGMVISERLVKEDTFSSVYIRMYRQDVRETKLGPELLTKDIPDVSEAMLQNLSSDGLIKVGTVVNGGDILAGIVSAKAQKQLTPEEKLLISVFGTSAKEVKNNSLRLPHGVQGIVVKTDVITAGEENNLPPSVLRRVKVWVAQLKTVSYGDKFSGYYGDKATVGTILPEEDMPFLEDGTPVDVILTPFYVKRMNIGQTKQMYYSHLADKLGVKLEIPNFEDIDEDKFEDMIKKAGLEKADKQTVYDGRTGKAFPQKVAVGKRYLLRLKHIAADKLHARSTGPYSLVTQQPLGGKAHLGGQRVGEMLVWGLEAHGAAHVLQEMLTIKSDDVKGRSDAYKAIIQGEKIKIANVPNSFNVLIKELNALGLRVELTANDVTEEKGSEKKRETKK